MIPPLWTSPATPARTRAITPLASHLKTGKWADGSTDAVTAAWSIGKATQEAPNGLIGVAPTTEGGSDGKITGVDATMEYRVAEREYLHRLHRYRRLKTCLPAITSCATRRINNHFAGTDAEVTVGEGAPLADCTITFDGNGGSGSMGPVTVKAGANYILPACGFTAPADQEFKAWEIGGTEYKVGDSYTVLGDTEIKALWKNSVITPTTYTVTVSNDGNGTGTATPSTAVAGTTIILTATPNTGYHFKEWEVISGGVTIKDDKFLMPNDNVEVKAIFEEDAPPAPTEFTITVKTDGNGTASASHAKAAARYGDHPDCHAQRRATTSRSGRSNQRQGVYHQQQQVHHAEQQCGRSRRSSRRTRLLRPPSSSSPLTATAVRPLSAA